MPEYQTMESEKKSDLVFNCLKYFTEGFQSVTEASCVLKFASVNKKKSKLNFLVNANII